MYYENVWKHCEIKPETVAVFHCSLRSVQM